MNHSRERCQPVRPILALCLLLPALFADAREVSVPVQIDYQFLRQALIGQIYTGPDQSREIWNDGQGCGSIVLSDPRIDSSNGMLRITNRTVVDISLPMGTGCVPVYQQTAILETYHQPQIEKDHPALRFDVVDMKVYEADRTPLAQGRALELLRQFAGPRLAALRVDLGSPLAEIRQFLPDFLPAGNAAALQVILDSLAFRGIAATPDSLAVVLGLTLDDSPVARQIEPPLTPAEIDRWEQGGRQWDAFITYAIKQAAMHSKSDAVREQLLELLIETRYDILTLLSGPVAGSGDPVREMFIDVWSRLAPILREVSHDLEGDLPLHYLTFIAAGDILQVLDELGPGAGLDISLDGLRRMARMLAPDDGHDPLDYSLEVDPLLRKLFGATPPAPPNAPAMPDKLSWLVKSAHAAPDTAALKKKLDNWAPAPDEIDSYLPLVHQLLKQTAAATQKSKKLDTTYKQQFHDLLLATAWQESCWRQFIKVDKRIRTIKSGSGSVGIMQVNSKVWRGFYDVKKLEKDIVYNAHAGSEILLHYFRDYALARESGKSRLPDYLARATYGAYNGGPRHLTRYRESGTKAELRKIDDAFWSKYKKIKAGDIRSVAGCYSKTTGTGGASGSPRQTGKADSKSAPAPGPAARSAGLLQSSPQNYTIQLLSSRNKTQIISFMREHKLEGKAEYFTYRHNNEAWYGLIYGSYASRQAAGDAAQSLKQRLQLSEPWIRQIAAIKKVAK